MIKQRAISSLAFIYPILACLHEFRSAFVPLENWYLEWGIYLNDGEVPYRDFYVPLPPLYVALFSFIARTPDPVFTSHLVSLIVQGFLGLGMYKLFAHFFQRLLAICLTLVLITFWTIHPTNLIGGYYEFAITLTCWSLIAVTKFLDSGMRFKYAPLLMTLSLASLVKQNFIVFWLILSVWLLVKIIMKTKDNLHKRIWLMSAVAFCLSFNYLALSIYLLYHNALDDFLRVMLDGGGKNIKVTTLIYNIFVNFASSKSIFTGFLFLVYLFSLWTFMTLKKRIWISLPLITGFALFNYMLFSQLWIFNERSSLTLILSAAIIALSLRDWPKEKIIVISLLVLVTGVAVRIILLDASQETQISPIILDPNGLLYQIGANSWLSVGYVLWFLVFGLINMRLLFVLARRLSFIKFERFHFSSFPFSFNSGKRTLENQQESVTSQQSKYWMFTYAIFASDLINAFNGGMSLDASILLSGFILGGFLSESLIWNQLNVTTSIVCIVIILTLFSNLRMISSVYSWYYWNEYRSGTLYKSQIYALRNMNLSESQKNLYESIRVAMLTAGISQRDSMAALPAQPSITRIIRNDWVTVPNLYCPVLWIDVCNESAARRTEMELIKDGPSFLLYFELQPETNTALDLVFRNGNESTMTRLPTQLVRSGLYKIIQTINNPTLDGSKIILLKRT
jgi:hypothetical protein